MAVRVEEVVRRSGLRPRPAAREGVLRGPRLLRRARDQPRGQARQGRRRRRGDRGPGELADGREGGRLQGISGGRRGARAQAGGEPRPGSGQGVRLPRLRGGEGSARGSPEGRRLRVRAGRWRRRRRSRQAHGDDRIRRRARARRCASATTSVEGNGAIPAWKLLNRVTWKPGDTYDPHDVGTTQGRLYDLGVFSSVRLDLPRDARRGRRRQDPRQARASSTSSASAAASAPSSSGRRFAGAPSSPSTTSSAASGSCGSASAPPTSSSRPSSTCSNEGPAAENDVQLTQPDIFGSNASLHALVGYDLGIAEGYQNYGPRAQLGVDRPFFRGRVLAGGSWNFQYLNFFNVNESVFNTVGDPFYGFQDPYRLALPRRVHPDRSARPSARPELRRLLARQRRAERRGARQRVTAT